MSQEGNGAGKGLEHQEGAGKTQPGVKEAPEGHSHFPQSLTGGCTRWDREVLPGNDRTTASSCTREASGWILGKFLRK